AACHSEGHGGPVLKRRRLDMTPGQPFVEGLHPVAEFPAGGFHGRKSLDISSRCNGSDHASIRKRSSGFLNHPCRGRCFGNANASARHHISVMCAGNIDLIFAVEAVWVVAANIEIYSAGACDWTDDCKVPCRFPAK